MTPTRRVRVMAKTVEAKEICSFELVNADYGALPPFSAGSHIDVHLNDGLVRQYSLCNDPRETHRYKIAVLREASSRGGSAAMHALEVGQELRISDPKNHFPLAHDAQYHLLIAGGIGITPIMCMAERLAHVGADFELHYCTRSVERTAFFKNLQSSEFSSKVNFHHAGAPISQRLDIAAVVSTPAAGKHLYVCGPAGFMDAVLSNARAAGWQESALHREYFAGAGPSQLENDGAFEIQIASTGAVITVGAQQNAIAALSAAGIAIPVSCEQGVCGTCLTRVLSGTPDHRDMYLTDEEHLRGDQFTPCCSRSKSPRLVIDL